MYFRIFVSRVHSTQQSNTGINYIIVAYKLSFSLHFVVYSWAGLAVWAICWIIFPFRSVPFAPKHLILFFSFFIGFFCVLFFVIIFLRSFSLMFRWFQSQFRQIWCYEFCISLLLFFHLIYRFVHSYSNLCMFCIWCAMYGAEWSTFEIVKRPIIGHLYRKL